MKLIMTMEPFTVTPFPVVADSKETVIDEARQAWETAKGHNVQARSEAQARVDTLPNPGDADYNTKLEVYLQSRNQNGGVKKEIDYVTVCGVRFATETFESREGEFHPPTVRTLEEWFDYWMSVVHETFGVQKKTKPAQASSDCCTAGSCSCEPAAAVAS